MPWHKDLGLWVDVGRDGDAGATVRLAGDLDITSAQAIRCAVAQLAPGTGRIAVDLSRVTYCDVAGLRVLLALQQLATDAGSDVILRYPPMPVRRILSLFLPPGPGSEYAGSHEGDEKGSPGLAGLRPAVGAGEADGLACPPVPSRAVVAACEQAVGQALRVGGADTGNLQLLDPATGALRIVAQQGFGRRFLDFFEIVHDEDCACGAALAAGRAVWVPEVATSPVFTGTPALEAMLEAGSQAVASVPVRARNRSLIAMMSVHYHRPTTWSEQERRRLEAVAAAVGQLLSGT